jgi:hypothetical protein
MQDRARKEQRERLYGVLGDERSMWREWRAIEERERPTQVRRFKRIKTRK